MPSVHYHTQCPLIQWPPSSFLIDLKGETHRPERMSFRKKFIMRWELKIEKTGPPCCRSRYSGKRELSVCYTEGFYKTCGRNEGETQQGG